MQANPRTLDALFNSQLRYVVPMFQRLYAWRETPQWATLWEDVAEKAVLQLRGIASNPHYLGALIIEGVRPSSPREVKRFLVIDGQQRLTTLQLLLCAYRDIARLKEWKTLDRAVTRYVENGDQDVMEHPEEEAFKLWPTTLNRSVFRDIIRAGSKSAVEKCYPLIRLPRKRKPEPRSNLVEGYLYFSARISEWIAESSVECGKSEEDTAFTLLQALQQDFCVVEIALSEGDDSQEIFYSLNSQGIPLSQSDLLRSLVFMRAEKEKVNRDEIFNEYWSAFETDFWSETIRRGGRSYARLDLGLRYFLMAKTGQMVDARRVNEEYKRWVSAHPPRYPNVREELADFTRHAEVYRRYESVDSSSLPCTDLRRILIDLDVSTALPLILFLELDSGLSEAGIAECLSAIESFIVRRAFTGEETKEYNKLFVDVIGSLIGKPTDAILPALRDKLLAGGGATRQWPTDVAIIEKAVGRRVFDDMRTPALRLLLERLEYSLRTKKSEDAEIRQGLQIEHVMPQKWGANWLLKGKQIPPNVAEYPILAKEELVELADSIRRRNLLLHTIGNLTLLNKHLNPAVGNASFTTKVSEYKNSVLRLNRHFDSATDWDEDAIVKRSRELGGAICAIWPRG